MANFAQQMVHAGLNLQIPEILRTSHKLLGSPQKFGGNPVCKTKVVIMISTAMTKGQNMTAVKFRISEVKIDSEVEMPDECQWFLGCDEKPEWLVHHPVLEFVPACPRCAERS